MNDYLNCMLHGMAGFSAPCEEWTGSPILPPPIEITYIPPPCILAPGPITWPVQCVPPGVIVVPPIETPPGGPVPIPEPSTALLLCASLLVASLVKRWRKA